MRIRQSVGSSCQQSSTNTHANTNTHAITHTHANTHANTNTHTHTHAHANANTNANTHTHANANTNANANTHTHTVRANQCRQAGVCLDGARPAYRARTWYRWECRHALGERDRRARLVHG